MEFKTTNTTLKFGNLDVHLTIVENLDELFDDLIKKGEEHEDFKDERIPYWAELWASAIAMSEYLVENALITEGVTVTEMGCGLGLPSIVAGKLGAEVTMTDYLDDALDFAKLNWNNNFTNKKATFSRLDWRNPDVSLAADLLLASDVAYEKRALAHFRAGRIEDALVDYAKSLALFPNSEALLGQAEVKASLGDHVGALVDYQKSVDAAAPYEPVFWKCRRMKGEYHAQRNELDKAIFELKLVTKRPFAETDPNFPFRKQAWQLYSEVLLKAGKKVEAAAALQEALAIVDNNFSGNLLDSNGGTQEKTVRGAVATA